MFFVVFFFFRFSGRSLRKCSSSSSRPSIVVRSPMFLFYRYARRKERFQDNNISKAANKDSELEIKIWHVISSVEAPVVRRFFAQSSLQMFLAFEVPTWEDFDYKNVRDTTKTATLWLLSKRIKNEQRWLTRWNDKGSPTKENVLESRNQAWKEPPCKATTPKQLAKGRAQHDTSQTHL